jgi:hypothetical protein
VPQGPRATPISKTRFFPGFEAGNDFFRGSDETEAARQIIGRTQRENAQWNAGLDQSRAHLYYRAIAAGDKDEIGGFSQGFLVVLFLSRLISRLMSRLGSAAINCFRPCSASPALGLCIKMIRMSFSSQTIRPKLT